MASFGDVVALLKQTGKEIGEDNCTSQSAAIAYYTLLSLPPLLVIIVGVAGLVFGSDVVQARLTGEVGGLVGESGAEQIRTMIESAGDFGGGSFLGRALGLLALAFGATGAFAQLQKALNRAWEVRPDPEKGGVKKFVIKRALSLGMVLTIAFLLVVSLAASAVLSALADQVQNVVGPAGTVFAWVANVALTLGLFTLLFAAIFKVLPDAEIEWSDVWLGGFVTALLLVIGQFVIGFYLGRSNPGEAYGAAGSVIVLLVWIYFAALILLIGAEFTQVWARRYGKQIMPEGDAVRVVEQERVVRDGEERPAEKEERLAEKAAPDEREEMKGEGRHPYAKPREPEPRSGLNE